MAKKLWNLFAVMVLSVNFAYAADGTGGGKLFKDPSTGIEMVYVKGGCYQMGDIFDAGDDHPEEKPVHEVCVDDFYIGKYEVTQGQWKAIMGSNTSAFSTCGEDNCPIDNVSWSDVQEFISKLNSRSGGSKYRLPTEAEWEYAARSGGKREKYSGGKDVDSVAWYTANSGGKNHPVGTKAPNGLGIHDMSGNVWEWTNDLYGSYAGSARKNPTGPNKPTGPGIDHVIRGGCTSGGPDNQRTARRNYGFRSTDADRAGKLGFRLLKTS